MSTKSKNLGVVLALVTAILLGACAGQTTGQFIDDSGITTRVKAKLIDDPVTSGFAIRVETFNGTVQLSGFVKTDKERRRASEIAGAIPGVKAVRNDLIVK